MIRQEDVYKIGETGKPHGVKGEISLMFDDDVFDRVDAPYLVLDIDGILVPFFMEEYRFKGRSTALVKFCAIDTKEQAATLTGCSVFFPKSLSDRDENEITWDEIKGFRLIDNNIYNKEIGTITSVDDSTANVLFEVTTPQGDDILIPAAEEFVLDMDTEKKIITVSLPEGLLDLDD